MRRRLVWPATARLATVVCLTAVALAGAPAAWAADPGRPLEVLSVTGGCGHDYEAQKRIIADGLQARARVNVTVVHEGGESREHRVSIDDKPRWAAGYDVVFHNECFAHVNDPEFVGRIVAEHARGVPALTEVPAAAPAKEGSR